MTLIVYPFLFIFLIFVGCINNENASLKPDNDIKEGTKPGDKIAFINEGINYLYDSFEDNIYTTRAGQVVKTKKFPDYYGGAYVDVDQETVVIVVVDKDPKKYENAFKSRMKNHPFRMVEGKFSFNELQHISNEFVLFLKNNVNNEMGRNIVYGGIRKARNSFIIELENCSQSKIEELKKNFMDSPAIQFEQGERP